jgi:hypothetical protein
MECNHQNEHQPSRLYDLLPTATDTASHPFLNLVKTSPFPTLNQFQQSMNLLLITLSLIYALAMAPHGGRGGWRRAQ